MGDVGTGKSTIVEKLTGAIDRSSDSSMSKTKESEVFEIYDGSIIICDTPGTNPVSERFEHNIQLAHAFNARPVTCLLIVAKADTRMENTVEQIERYMDRLPTDFPEKLIGICVTHMDAVNWTREKLVPLLKKQLDIDTVLCSSLVTLPEDFKNDLLEQCVFDREAMRLNIDSEKFLLIFKISNTNRKVMKMSKEEIERFSQMDKDFKEKLQAMGEADQMSLTFEFNAWLSEEYIKTQKRFSDKNGFTLYGPNMASEAGHVSNLSSQLFKTLRMVRDKAAKYLKQVEDVDFRECPHCDLVWTKVEGCEGETTCGSRPSTKEPDTSTISGETANFLFEWDSGAYKLNITKKGKKEKKKHVAKQAAKAEGCGKKISWKDMKPAKNIPCEVKARDEPYMGDVKQLPEDAQKRFDNKFTAKLDSLAKLEIQVVKPVSIPVQATD